VLRPKGDFGVDADAAVFLNANGSSAYDLANLHDRIRKLLKKIYPTKKLEDFTVQPRTLGIQFHDSGLAMDLVPLITIDGPPSPELWECGNRGAISKGRWEGWKTWGWFSRLSTAPTFPQLCFWPILFFVHGSSVFALAFCLLVLLGVFHAITGNVQFDDHAMVYQSVDGSVRRPRRPH
jgi:hypothetical protein